MKIEDVKTLTYTGNTLDINGRSVQIQTALTDCEFVQFHKGRDYYIEEPKMEQVSLTKYEFLFAEYDEAIELEDNPPVVEPTQEGSILAIKADIQSHLDNTAKGLGFDDINSISKFLVLTESIFYADAMALTVWQNSVWEYIEPELKKVEDGLRTVPTKEEALAEIPQYSQGVIK